MVPKILLQEKIKEIANRPWHPVDVARVNDQVVRMALCRGAFHWHKHEHDDELFFVIEGELTIQLCSPHSNITLQKGEMAVVPKNVEHCSKSSVDTYILMFEPSSLQSKGD